ncbi:glycosyltransferase [Arthrobacter sp. MDT3-24]
MIIHQTDLARPSPGGIDTCLRGIAKYAPDNMTLAFVGVDTGAGPKSRRLGVWELYKFEDREVWFLPVARVDPGDQRRFIPHSIKLAVGFARFLRRMPDALAVQAHRMDIALLIPMLRRKPLVYMVHTQQGGLTGKTSDSFWRFAGTLHEALERLVVRRAADVIVFNREYSTTVQGWNQAARFSPTWWDPELILQSSERRTNAVCWVGRLEVPKDPELALDVIEELERLRPSDNWSLSVLGSGTMLAALEERLNSLPTGLRARVQLHGRVEPDEVARIMGQCNVFLMTSHPGYEGYPRVLVEALASGLPAVVTEGSDTGGIVEDDKNGFVTNRDPVTIAGAISRAINLSSETARESVGNLAAPAVVNDVMFAEGKQ